ncbi:MAG TPA: hypothetical protein VK578_18685 [Edaphobacter sp.]|nr:hypothetical protein [Edaphobacter sp.]
MGINHTQATAIRQPDQSKQFHHRKISNNWQTIAFAVLLTAAHFAFGQAQKPSAESVNEANNPLTPKITINFQNQGAPQLYDTDDGSNAFLFRGLIPHKLGGTGQLFRFTLPVVTTPSATGNMATGLGDLNVFDLFPFLLKKARMEVAIGPQLTFPTASETATGTGKWQAGLATLAVAPRKWGLGGGLVTWQHSFAGDSSRSTQNNLAAQPLILYNLPRAWYLRSTATWNFDLEQAHYSIPIGAGAGKVWLLKNGTTVNLFAEPQWTVARDGAFQPKFQVFAGLNLQFPIGKK